MAEFFRRRRRRHTNFGLILFLSLSSVGSSFVLLPSRHRVKIVSSFTMSSTASGMWSAVLSAASCESGICGSTSNENQHDPTTSIQNFRLAAGLPEGIVFRCASTDVLGNKLKQIEESGGNENRLSAADKTVLCEGGLILDLRSAVERKEDQAQYWMNHPTLTPKSPICVVEVDMTDSIEKIQQLFLLRPPSQRRFVMRIDLLNQPLFVKYCDDEWLSQIDKKRLLWYKLADGNALHEWRMDELNRRGLAGLNEAILETGHGYLSKALQIITLYREATMQRQNGNEKVSLDDKKIIIHCVQGKDRTGMLVMLLQSLLGVSDEEIIDDYFRSNGNFHKPGKSHDGESSVAAAAAAAATKATKGKLDRRIFSGTNRQAMVDTLAFLREHYGSVSPGYLDAIGFDERWRRRLKAVLEAQGTHVISDAKTTSSEEEEGEYVDVPRSRL